MKTVVILDDLAATSAAGGTAGSGDTSGPGDTSSLAAEAQLSGSLVRYFVGPDFRDKTIAGLPVERLTYKPRRSRAADPGVATIDDVLTIPAHYKATLDLARMGRVDLIVVPCAGPYELIGLSQWYSSRGGATLPAVVVLDAPPVVDRPGVAAPRRVWPESDGPETAELIAKAAYNRIARILERNRIVLCTRNADEASWYKSVGYGQVPLAAIADGDSAALVDLLWPIDTTLSRAVRDRDVFADQGPSRGLAEQMDQATLRNGLGLPRDKLHLVLWSGSGEEAAAWAGELIDLLDGLPWSNSLVCLVVGSHPDREVGTLTLGFTAEPSDAEELSGLCALADVHVMGPGASSRKVVSAAMEQGRVVLATDGEPGSELLEGGQRRQWGRMELGLVALLQNAEVITAVGSRNRRNLLEEHCVFA